MVIVCPECSTKFRVNSEHIPDAGAKVRCARCKHVFLAEKPIPEEELAPIMAEPEVAPELPEEEPSTFADESETTENAFDDSSAAPEPESAPEPEPTPEPEEDGFSYDQFRELDSDKVEDENFTFGGTDEIEESLEEAPTTDFDSDVFAEEPEGEESFSFSGPENDSPIAEPEERTAKESIAEETEQVDADVAADTEDIEDASEAASMTNEEKLASIFADDDESEEKTEAELPAPAPKKSSPASSIIRVLLLLILGLAIIGGALYFINGPEQIEQAIQQILGQQARPAESGQIALINLEGKFINNQEAGELFVIRGEATNNFKEARGAIQVKGVIFDQNGKPLLQKTIFCGNPIDDQELQTLPFSKLEEMMRNQFGKSLDNMKVNSKEAIPFVIAFRDLPNSLSEFSVDVTSSEPATK